MPGLIIPAPRLRRRPTKRNQPRVAVLGIDRESLSVHDRLMATGFNLSNGQFVLSGIPFKNYDIILLSGWRSRDGCTA